MQTTVDLNTLYRGKLTDLFNELDVAHNDIVIKCNYVNTVDAQPDHRYKTSINRSRNAKGYVDTLYISCREEPCVVIAYIEFRYGCNHFEVFVNPTHRDLELSVTLTAVVKEVV